MNVFDLRGPDFLFLYFFLVLFSLIAALILRWLLRAPGGDMFPLVKSLDPSETAYLAGGPRMAVDTAIAALVHSNALKLKSASQTFTINSPLVGHPNPVERAVYHLVEYGSTTLSEIRQSAKTITAHIRDKLLAANLILTPGQALTAQIAPALLMLLTLIVGIIKIEIGVSRNKPVGFLVFICLVTGVISLILAVTRVRTTRAGSAMLSHLRNQNSALKTSVRSAPSRVGQEDLALAIALFGPAILASSTDLTSLRQTLWPPNTSGSSCSSSSGCGSGSSCSSGSSCGGSSCGGGGCGGGGCGGCGGG